MSRSLHERICLRCNDLVGLNQDRALADVRLDARNRAVNLALVFRCEYVLCPEGGSVCWIKDHAAERSWCRLDASQFQFIPAARVRRMHI